MINVNEGIIYSETQVKMWITMLKSKESAQPAESIWAGLVRVSQITSDYVREMYGHAAIEYNGRYYTPDCKLMPAEPTTAAKRRASLRGGHDA